jgi:hypothetical protein
MRHFQLFSRRDTESKVDFRPDVDPDSPFAQLRRLAVHLSNTDASASDITDCNDALNYLREYTYRKIFTGTSHEDFVRLDKSSPEVIDWLIAVHETESAHFQSTKNRR